MSVDLLTRAQRRRWLRQTLGKPKIHELVNRWEMLAHKLVDSAATRDEAREFLDVDRLVDPFITYRLYLRPWRFVGLWVLRRKARNAR